MSTRQLISFLLALFCLTVQAITIPKEHVFVFERSTNTNYVCYDINLENGSLSQKQPLNAYWVLGDETRIEGLTFLDRKMAYGIKVISAEKNEALVHLTAYKDLSIRICKHKGKWVGIVKMHGRELVIQKMYAQMKSSLSVKCEYVEIYGTDITTGEKRSERITP
ncbi:MAG: DUF4833 domain-containing protein [Bacteroidaceae bacterium]|nr:DUF4833 domain-containing protein [Bacteroidaceae bacterium]